MPPACTMSPPLVADRAIRPTRRWPSRFIELDAAAWTNKVRVMARSISPLVAIDLATATLSGPN